MGQSSAILNNTRIADVLLDNAVSLCEGNAPFGFIICDVACTTSYVQPAGLLACIPSPTAGEDITSTYLEPLAGTQSTPLAYEFIIHPPLAIPAPTQVPTTSPTTGEDVVRHIRPNIFRTSLSLLPALSHTCLPQ